MLNLNRVLIAENQLYILPKSKLSLCKYLMSQGGHMIPLLHTTCTFMMTLKTDRLHADRQEKNETYKACAVYYFDVLCSHETQLLRIEYCQGCTVAHRPGALYPSWAESNLMMMYMIQARENCGVCTGLGGDGGEEKRSP